jgi:APA family basic amino acid/polyamine antiporter
MLGWTAVGLLIYFGYGYRHSHLRRQKNASQAIVAEKP